MEVVKGNEQQVMGLDRVCWMMPAVGWILKAANRLHGTRITCMTASHSLAAENSHLLPSKHRKSMHQPTKQSYLRRVRMQSADPHLLGLLHRLPV